MPAFVRVALCAGLLLACCTTADAPAPVVVTEGPPVSGPATPVLEIPPVDPRIQRADALFAPVTPDKPGQAVIVTQRGQTVYERYLCSANLEHGVRVTENNRFHVASVCKQFTAYAVHVLAQEGKCDLDADIRTWVPDMPAYSRPITPRQLLSHTSGVRDEWGLFLLGGNSFPDLMTQRATLALIRNQKAPNFEPGASYEYSNSGYTLLAAIVEKASGKTLRQFLDEQVFCPLGMTGMLVFDNPAELVLNRADSYSPAKGGGVRVSRHNYTPYGATNLNARRATCRSGCRS